MMAATAWVLVALLLLTSSVDGAAKRKRRRPKRELIVETGPSEDDVEDAGLLGDLVSYANLVERGTEYYHEVQLKRFRGNVVGYVTPWNRKGYEFAVIFNSKFTHISPVWYQLKKVDGNFVLQGGHEVNTTWIKEVQTPTVQGASVPKLVPRVILELTPEEMMELLSYPDPAIEILLNECSTYHYDGLVLEAWVQWVAINGMNNDQFRGAALGLIKKLAHALHTSKSPKELLVVVPPPIPSHFRAPFFNTTDFLAVHQVVDGFSVMTYDFSDGVNAGPNSPTHWLRTNVDALLRAAELHKPPVQQQHAPPAPDPRKLLMGTNFYGYRYRTDRQDRAIAMVASELLKVLQKHAPTLQWDPEHLEHYFEYKEGKKHYTVYYPTPSSLAARLQLASELGVGLSIWELGQGLERFMDLL